MGRRWSVSGPASRSWAGDLEEKVTVLPIGLRGPAGTRQPPCLWGLIGVPRPAVPTAPWPAPRLPADSARRLRTGPSTGRAQGGLLCCGSRRAEQAEADRARTDPHWPRRADGAWRRPPPSLTRGRGGEAWGPTPSPRRNPDCGAGPSAVGGKGGAAPRPVPANSSGSPAPFRQGPASPRPPARGQPIAGRVA